MTEQAFSIDRFTDTEHATADEKALFCKWFVRFVLAGFAPRLFAPRFYRRLSNIFGHIAHYDETGFWETWFSTPEQQRQFVRRIHEWIPIGDAPYCWSDVERELKSWAVMNAETIEEVLGENERKFAEAAATENARRAALAKRSHQQFSVVARSTNTNSFGHRQYVVVADDGGVYKVQRCYQKPWEHGQVIIVPLVSGEPNWLAIQCECPERFEPNPVEV